MIESAESEIRKIMRRDLQDAIYTAAVINGIDDLNEYKAFWSREVSSFVGHLESENMVKMQEIVNKMGA